MNKIIEKIRGYRTVIVAGLLSLAPAWDALKQIVPVLATDPNLPKLIPPGWMPYYTLAVTIVMIWMRVITTTGLGQKE